MKYNLHIIADHLKEYHPVFYKAPSTDLTLSYLVIAKNNTSFVENKIYLVEEGKEMIFSKLDRNMKLSFIVLQKDAETFGRIAATFSDKWDMIVLQTSQKLQTVYQRIMQILMELNEWYDEFTDTVLRQEDLQKQMQCGVRFLKNPLALFDMSMSLIAWAGKMPEEVSDPVWSMVLKRGYNTLESFPINVRKEVLESVGEDRVIIAPPLHKKNVVHNMSATLFHNKLPFACIAMNELIEPIDEAEYTYVMIIKKVLEQSPVLLRNIVLAKDKGSKILLRLLRGQAVDEKQMQIFLRERGWNQKDTFTLFIFRYEQKERMNETSYQSHIRTIQSVTDGLEFVYHDSSLIAISRNRSAKDTLEKLKKVREKLCLPIGISMPFEGCESLHEAYLQAQAAWEHTEGKLVYVLFQNIYEEYIIELLNQKNNLYHICHPALLKMIGNGQDEWNQELLDTLYCYLKLGKRITTAADRLNIHRNTMINRLRIIDECLGFSVTEATDEETQLLYISCMILCRKNL